MTNISLRALLLTLAVSIGIAAAVSNPAYVGCFKDAYSNRDLSGLSSGETSLTIESCIAFCSERKYAFAGAQGGNTCWCGNSYGSYGTFADRMCNVPCSANVTQICGGYLRNSIYKTPPRELGCLRRGFIRQGYTGLATNNPTDCRLTCRKAGYEFCGLEGQNCRCGEAWSNISPGTSCDLPCPGDNQYKCGGAFQMTVWRA